ncbi:epocide hydrolase domain-containing protein [Gonapodya prolifera JEL478]|uniref:Epocide hydrolase domain-containing protein n=1 Tax=Gonapodya prolifera (strain JEL478) TaxID=1344416 RepID=A0A139AQ90_GONPJ|nr:epocide hydrolase domain-containing protein [Gonapodya prolifera JEL478]|eukprot:KXS18931.1 epocide hydrolase domain-containing protein [Gonapodya prolifera JEL478]
MASPVPFRVICPPHLLATLKDRLRNVRFPENSLANPIGGGDTWEYGMPNRVARKLVDHWLNKYDWPAWEAKINEFKHYKLDVSVPVGAGKDDPRGHGTVSVHFIHERSPRADAIPIILTHGWPGSFVEFLDVIRPLTHPPSSTQTAFHVVVPSLVGFGFSSAAPVRDFGVIETAKVMNHVMKTLGYHRYVGQGGDWGAFVTKALAALFPQNCKAIHLNFPIFPRPPKEVKISPPTPIEQARMETYRNVFERSGTGYQRIQETKPQTLAFAMSDSPIGLLAWIGEKFHEIVDLRGGDGDFSPTLSLDHLLTNVMIYYISNSIGSSFRLYRYQFFLGIGQDIINLTILTQPVGIAVFPYELYIAPRSWVNYWCPKLVHWSEFKQGGHFAALEQTSNFIEDVRAFAKLHSVRGALFDSKA